MTRQIVRRTSRRRPLLDRYVQAARAEGRSWTEIGAALGVTKQAAHERFVDAPLAWPTNFSKPARQVVQRALTQARGSGHRYLGTEHLLLALTRSGSVAGAAPTPSTSCSRSRAAKEWQRTSSSRTARMTARCATNFATLLEREAPEIAEKLRAAERRRGRRRGRG